MKRCAVCWVGNERNKPGTNDSTWLCDRCYHSPSNKDWRATPGEEDYSVDELDAGESHGMDWPRSAGPFETPRCIEIIKHYCLGVSQRKTAVKVSCSLSFVIRTISHWRDNHGFFMESLRQYLSRSN